MPLTLARSHPEFECPPPGKFTFIIWNLYLTDKLTPLQWMDLRKEKITHIIAILPEEGNFLKLNEGIGETSYTVLPYGHEHTPGIPKELYEEVGKKIDEIAKRPEGWFRNVLIFCNNGFQRSIPFLTYYMMRFHPEECPTVEKALDILLRGLGKMSEKEKYVEAMKSVF
jgi:hypothetical protein